MKKGPTKVGTVKTKLKEGFRPNKARSKPDGKSIAWRF